MARLLRINRMLSRTESIDGFHLKVSRTERGLYEEFLKTEEAAILAEIQHYFADAKLGTEPIVKRDFFHARFYIGGTRRISVGPVLQKRLSVAAHE